MPRNLHQVLAVKALQCVLVDTTVHQGLPMKVVAEEMQTSVTAGMGLEAAEVTLAAAAAVLAAILVLVAVAQVTLIPLSPLMPVMHLRHQ